MSEIWIAAAVGVVGSAMSARGAEKGQDKQNTFTEAQQRLQIGEDRKTQEWQLKSADYYQQLGKQRRRNARAATFDPTGAGLAKYTDKPRVDFAGEAPKLPEIEKAAAETPKKKKKKGLLGMLTKPSLDPAGLFS